ncbi:MAG: tRNA (adenosine(37)-N6)-threonylcarbamoyltransferase complex ATPase subunit type 1 TsaE [Patescibacteria group bacterium]
MRILSHSQVETFKIGLKLAKNLTHGHIFALIGDMGGGKTYFAKGFARGLGIHGMINSPTFVLMKTYKINKGALRTLCHVDAYRLRRIGEVLDVGLREYVGRKDTVLLVEWADKLRPLLRNLPLTVIRFAYVSRTDRRITIQKNASWR